jgi:prepilin-type N-terminal cleavage/methylation domain-containing protein
MYNKGQVLERGFTMLECAIAIAIISVLVAIALPRLNNSMREHRVNIAMRQVVDALKRAKMQAISENRNTAVAVDTGGRRMGVVFLNDDATVSRMEFIPLPDGVSFQRPAGVTVAPPDVTTAGVVSFAQQDAYYQQGFTSRGFPSLASGADVVSIFVGNGQSFRAVTMTSVGGIRTYTFENRAWVNTSQQR